MECVHGLSSNILEEDAFRIDAKYEQKFNSAFNIYQHCKQEKKYHYGTLIKYFYNLNNPFDEELKIKVYGQTIFIYLSHYCCSVKMELKPVS